MKRRTFFGGTVAVASAALAAEPGSLRRAAVTGDVAALRQMAASDRAALYARDENGDSIFLLACFARQKAIVEYLLAQNIRLDFHEKVAAGKWDLVDAALRENP